MRFLAWAIVSLGLWILLSSIFSAGQTWIGIIGGLLIAILALIPALRAKT